MGKSLTLEVKFKHLIWIFQIAAIPESCFYHIHCKFLPFLQNYCILTVYKSVVSVFVNLIFAGDLSQISPW